MTAEDLTPTVPLATQHWDRPDPFGYYHGCEYGNWHDHTAGWFEPVRDLRGRRNADDAGGESRVAVPCRVVRVPDYDHLHSMDLNRVAKRDHGARGDPELSFKNTYKPKKAPPNICLGGVF